MHERIIGLYEENAKEWDRLRRGPIVIEKSWIDRFLSLLPDDPDVLDIGCGTGEPIARYLIDCGARVMGLDSSPSLIAICKQRFPKQEWIVGDMRSLSLDRTFDGLLAWHSFFHLHADHQRPMFARFAAHTRPGAILMFTSGTSLGETISSWQGEPLYHGSLDTGEYRQLLIESGFTVIDHYVRDPRCGEATIWLAKRSS